MKKTLGIFLTMAVLLCAVPHVVFAATTTEGGLTYTLNDSNKTATLTNGKSASSNEVVIPGSVNYNGTDYTVTAIGERAFQGCRGLTSVTIPNSVTTIGRIAFDGCSGLTSVTIPNSVTTIDEYAFQNCSKLTLVEIPGSVTTIGNFAFYGCSKLASINVDPANPNFKSNDGVLFNKDGTELILYPQSKTGSSYDIPSGVQTIGDYAFQSCRGLTSVTIPDSVTTIGEHAFDNCSGLTSVEIPDSVTTIGKDAFFYCTSLRSVTIGSGVTIIGDQAFYNCSGLTSVTIGNGVTTIGRKVFDGCSKLASINVDPANPNFKSNDGVLFNKDGTELILYPSAKTGDSYNIPSGVKSIGYGAFQSCSGLTSVTIPDSVTTISNSAFQGCRGLTSITIPDSVTTIGNSAFGSCRGLTSITIPCNFDKGKFNSTKITVSTSDSSKFTNSGGTSGTFALSHECEDWAITREPTCTTSGEKTGTCTVCGTVTETIEPKPHSIVPVAEVKATCTKTGTRAHYKCSSCNTLFSDAAGTTSTTVEALTTDMLDHTLTHTPALDSTCVTKGMDEYWTCSVCNGIFSDSAGRTSTTLDKLTTDMSNHTLTHIPALDPTCVTKGRNEYWTCSVCNGIFSDSAGRTSTTLDALTTDMSNHTLMHIPAVDSTCVTKGRKEYWTCSVCNGIFSDSAGTTSTTLEALATDMADHTLTRTPALDSTCVTKGRKEYWTCSKCNGIFSDAGGTTSTTLEELKLKALGHDIQKVEEVESNCVTAGKKEHYKCKRCEALFSDEAGTKSVTADELKLSKLDHNWGSGEVTTAATSEKPGIKTYKCSRCGETKTEPVKYVSVPGGGDGGSTDSQPNVAGGDNNSTNLHPGAGGGDSSSNNSYSNAEPAAMARRAFIKTGDQLGIWVMFYMALLLLSAYGVLVGVRSRKKRGRK